MESPWLAHSSVTLQENRSLIILIENKMRRDEGFKNSATILKNAAESMRKSERSEFQTTLTSLSTILMVPGVVIGTIKLVSNLGLKDLFK